MPEYPYLQWPVFRRSVVAAFERSLTHERPLDWVQTHLCLPFCWQRSHAMDVHRADSFATVTVLLMTAQPY